MEEKREARGWLTESQTEPGGCAPFNVSAISRLQFRTRAYSLGC